MKLLQDFKEFAFKGNVIDLAVGVIIGGAFGKLVSSLVSDIIMPFVGVLIGGIDFTQLKILIHQPSDDVEAVYLFYGNFLQAILDFVIIAFVIFMMIRTITHIRNKIKKEAEATPVEPTKEELLLTEIRDLLSKRQ